MSFYRIDSLLFLFLSFLDVLSLSLLNHRYPIVLFSLSLLSCLPFSFSFSFSVSVSVFLSSGDILPTDMLGFTVVSSGTPLSEKGKGVRKRWIVDNGEKGNWKRKEAKTKTKTKTKKKKGNRKK